MKKRYLFFSLLFVLSETAFTQIDPELLRRVPKDTNRIQLNMDAVYNRPFLQVGKLPVAIGGYAEANYHTLGY